VADKPQPALTRVANERLFLLVLATLAGLTPLSIDMYLPAMPALAEALRATPAQTQFTLSAYMAGFAGGMLLWGPIGDRFGRRRPMIVGLILFVIASAVCATATGIEAVIALRVLQALGGCAVNTLAQAAVADVFDRERSARAFSLMQTVFLGAPLVAPTLGGLLLAGFGWRSLFWALGALGLCCLAGLAILPETLPKERRRSIAIGSVLSAYRSILTSRRFLAYAAINCLLYGGMFAYIAATPFIYIEYFGVPAHLYGLLFGVNVVAMILVSIINSRLVVRRGADRMLRLGVIVAAASGVALLVTGLTGFGGLFGIAAPLFGYLGVLSLVGSNAGAAALSEFRSQAGAASAVLGALSMGAGGVSSAVVGALADGTPRPMAILIGGGAVLALVINLAVLKPVRT
jgi:MFS transporter, DHA1 family, multidrug resistance protein